MLLLLLSLIFFTTFLAHCFLWSFMLRFLELADLLNPNLIIVHQLESVLSILDILYLLFRNPIALLLRELSYIFRFSQDILFTILFADKDFLGYFEY